MTKVVLEDAKVVVNGVVLSGHAFNIDTPQEKEQVDVSGFGAREYVPGLEDSTLTIQFIQDFASTKVHQTLEPLYRGGSTFPIYVMADDDAGTSATNPLYGGSANIYTYNGLSGGLNSRAEVTATFRPAGGTNFAWGTVAP